MPAEAVEKVQVYDKKSEEAEFSGIDDGQRERTINLMLNEDHKKGYFGDVVGGLLDIAWLASISIAYILAVQVGFLFRVVPTWCQSAYWMTPWMHFQEMRQTSFELCESFLSHLPVF